MSAKILKHTKNQSYKYQSHTTNYQHTSRIKTKHETNQRSGPSPRD